MNKAERDESAAYLRFVKGITLEWAKFPKAVADDERFLTLKHKKGGRRYDETFSVSVALVEDCLYLKYKGYFRRTKVLMLRNASEYGAVDVCERMELGISTYTDRVQLLGDAIKQLYVANGLRVSSMFGYKPLLRPWRTPPTGAAQQQQLA